MLLARSSSSALKGARTPQVAVRAAARPLWLPGSDAPAHLDGTLPGDFGFDPLGLGANKESLKWFAEAERVHARWAMLGAAGILGQEIIKPEVWWYDAPTKIALPFDIVGLVAFQIFAMQWVELLRLRDFKNPNSVNKDPIFNNRLPDHEVGYPGGVFAPFVPGNLDELKVKEIKNGRLAMLGFIGFVMAAQTTGKGPLAALAEHLADPLGTTVFSKAAIVPGQVVSLPCMIPPVSTFQGIDIPTPCFAQALWP